jgi:hypothetical protein
MNIIKFSGVVIEKGGFTFIIQRFFLDWVIIKQKDKRIIEITQTNPSYIKEQFNLDVSELV